MGWPAEPGNRRGRRGFLARPGGFTLVELAVVLLIMGIVAALAVPRLASSLAYHRVEAAAERLAADLAWAQRRARLQSQPQAVSFAPSAGSYTLCGMPDPSRPSADYAVELDQAPYHVAVQSAAFGGDAELVFNGHGLPDSGGSVVLRAGTHQRTLSVEASTGQATID